ncbi:MAG: LysR family transcriptional regulator [Burkholderiales bacterium]|nr:LysR family transcriptional regulator [Burkholderiales bacterium]
MDHLDCLRTFVAVADSGGLAKAARLRGTSAPAATRAIAALEQRLGARLLHRTTRSVRLTEAGEHYLAEVRRLLAELEAAEAAVIGVQHAPQGMLAVTAPANFGRRHVAPILLDFLGRHPLVHARGFFVDRLVHLIDEGYDLAVRIAHLPDSGLTALPVGQLRRVIVASPEYLEKHGTPRSPADLAQHQAVGLSFDGQAATPWQFNGRSLGKPPVERLVTNATDVRVAAVCAGHGLGRALAYQVIDEVQAGRLRIVMAEHEPPPVPVHLVYPAGRAATAKLRAFIDFAAERLRALPVLQGRGLAPLAKTRRRR